MLLVNEVQFPEQGRGVFDRINDALSHHVDTGARPERAAFTYAGAVLSDADSIAAAEERHVPVPAACPGGRMAGSVRALAQVLLEGGADAGAGLRRFAAVLTLRPGERLGLKVR